MEIHPIGPVHSIKDFFLHLFIITLGILIALSLEGARESLHNHHLVNETRANFQSELRENRALLVQFASSATTTVSKMENVLNNRPEIQRNPRSAEETIKGMGADFVVLRAAARDTALSTGALSLMDPDEVRRYTRAYTAQRAFEEMEARLESSWYELSAYSEVDQLLPEERRAAVAKLRICLSYMRSLLALQQQTVNAYDSAMAASQ